MLELKDKTTAKLYEALTDTDQFLLIPRSEGCGCNEWRGWLSDINEHAAERYVKKGGNLIRAKAESEIDTSKVVIKKSKLILDNNTKN